MDEGIDVGITKEMDARLKENTKMIKGSLHSPDDLFRLSPKDHLQLYTHKHRTCVPDAQHLLMVDNCGQQR